MSRIREKMTIGMLGEYFAAKHLRKQGYNILAANFKSRFGEIDIICSKRDYIVFVEVKTRSQKLVAEAKDYVDRIKQDKLISTSKIYLEAVNDDLQPRFDVIEIYIENKDALEIKEINHIENAFE